jgi:hypothetical protein
MPQTDSDESFRIELVKLYGEKISFLTTDAIEKFGLGYLTKYRMIVVAGLHEVPEHHHSLMKMIVL